MWHSRPGCDFSGPDVIRSGILLCEVVLTTQITGGTPVPHSFNISVFPLLYAKSNSL